MNRHETTRNVPLRWIQFLDSFFPGFLIIGSTSKNQTKTRPKSDRFSPCEFFNICTTNTYNFSASKRSDSIPLVARLWTCQLTDSRQMRAGPCKFRQEVGTPRRRRPPSKPIVSSSIKPPNTARASINKLAIYCTKWDKTGRFTTSADFGHAAPTTCDDTPSRRPVFQVEPKV
jgi:hypothetical protein